MVNAEAREPYAVVFDVLSGRRLPPNAQLTPEAIAFALEHRLGALLWHYLDQNNQTHLLPDAEALRDLSAKDALVAQLRARAFRQINAAFIDANIPVVWLKGVVLARTVYPAPDLRPMYDLDLLIQPRHYRQAARILNRLGYRFLRPRQQPPDLAFNGWLSRANNLCGGPDDIISLDLHTYLLLPSTAPANHWFWSQQHAMTYNDMSFCKLTDDAMLLHLAAHAVLHHSIYALSFSLRLLDGHLLITHGDVHWDTIIDRATAWGWTTALWIYLSHVRAAFGTSIPAWVLEALDQRQTPSSRQKIQAEPSERNVWYHLRWRPFWLLQYLWYRVFPTRAYLIAWAAATDQPISANAQGLSIWRLHVKRWLRIINRLAASRLC